MAKILYFGPLADMLHKESEQLPLPADVTTIAELLGYLRKRGTDWALYLADDKIQVTINRQFSGVQNPISNTDEISLTSIRRRL
jgi:molybdopterin synthase sulfur carrier subunit